MLQAQNEAMLRLVREATDQGNVRNGLTARAIHNVLGVEGDVRSSAGHRHTTADKANDERFRADCISSQRNSIYRALRVRCSAYFEEGAPNCLAVTCACHRHFPALSPLGGFIT